MLRRLILAAALALLSAPAFASDMYVIVDISEQSMTVRVDGETVHNYLVSTGRKGHTTPAGAYGVERMHKRYFSRKYDNAPMPYAIFFHGGYAIHGTTDIKRLGKIASHGCVRLHPENARELYALVKDIGAENTRVWIKQ